jgi:hypothetical protein
MRPSGIRKPPKPPPEACNRIAAVIVCSTSPSSSVLSIQFSV